MTINNEKEIYEDYRICSHCGSQVLAANRYCTKCVYRMEDAEKSRTDSSDNSLRPDDNKSENCIAQGKKVSKAVIIAVVALFVFMVVAIGEGIYFYSTVQRLYVSYNNMEAMRDAAETEVKELQKKYGVMQKELESTKKKLENAKALSPTLKERWYNDIVRYGRGGGIGVQARNFWASENLVVMRKTDAPKKVKITCNFDSYVNLNMTTERYSAEAYWDEENWTGGSTSITIRPCYAGVSTITIDNDQNDKLIKIIVIVTD